MFRRMRGGSIYQIRVVSGQKLRKGETVTIGSSGNIRKALDGDNVLGHVTQDQTGTTAQVMLNQIDFELELSPEGTIKVWDEVDLETGYGGRV